MAEGADTLHYALRGQVLARFLGQLALMLALLTVVPLIASLWFAEYAFSLRYGVIILVLSILGLPLARMAAPKQIQTTEALSIAALAFIITPLIMTVPMMASGMPVLDAAFEAISAVTTTGLSTLANLENKPHTFLFARAWMQWYGGLGIIVLSVALLMGHHTALRRLVETTTGENLETNTLIHARRTLTVYVSLTVLAVIALWLLTGNGFAALTHALAAISTGGFSPYSNSLAGFDQWSVRFAVQTIGLLGAVPLILYYYSLRGNVYSLPRDMEVRALLILIVLVSLMLGFLIAHSGPHTLMDSFAHGLLLGISAQTTSGFASLDIGSLSDPAKAVLIISMIIGGGVGSTAGGFKLVRLLILLRLLQLLLHRAGMPSHAVSEARLEGKVLQSDEATRALLLILVYIIVVILSWLVFLLYDYDALDALFEVTSAVGTVGLSSGITRSELEPILKGVLCLDMWLGRLEIIALLIILYPSSWIGKRAN